MERWGSPGVQALLLDNAKQTLQSLQTSLFDQGEDEKFLHELRHISTTERPRHMTACGWRQEMLQARHKGLAEKHKKINKLVLSIEDLGRRLADADPTLGNDEVSRAVQQLQCQELADLLEVDVVLH